MNDQIIQQIATSVPGFLLAIVAHEWAHARMAKAFGDDTAERVGRLTFNPGAHIDVIGTIVFPLISIALGGFGFGWAKPVPIDSRNFKDFRKGVFWVSFAGPLANLILALVSSILFGIVASGIWQASQGDSAVFHQLFNGKTYSAIGARMLLYSSAINMLLAVFNLIPFPPLDGSRMLSSYLKGEALRKYESLAQYTNYVFFGIIILSFMGVSTIGYIISPAVNFGQKLPFYFLQLMN